jgi:hypothetical protein
MPAVFQFKFHFHPLKGVVKLETATRVQLQCAELKLKLEF